ncbi:MAG: restriction endonuclease [Gammaproteobacteria bacterium]|nr:restriction endonuclease [Gammaproteobacteria bacterium]MDH5650697.1 restriction endonuclease [Gammaproteobacteria bacterium]
MKFTCVYDHHHAVAEWEKRELHEWITDVFEEPSINIVPRCTSKIRGHVESELQSNGWALDVKLVHNKQLTVTAMKDDIAFQLQTGNMSRAPYDLLKLQYLFQTSKIECAGLAVPSREAAKKIGDNIANADRIWDELQLFDRVITVPILLIAFD